MNKATDCLTSSMIRALADLERRGEAAPVNGNTAQALIDRGLAKAHSTRQSDYPLRPSGGGRWGRYRRNRTSWSYTITDAGRSALTAACAASQVIDTAEKAPT